MCVEAGGPPAGTGCGGYVVGQTVKLLKEHHLLEDSDVVIFDVLGDVVCGGFAAPLQHAAPRHHRHRERLRLDLRHEPHRRTPSVPSRRTTGCAWAAWWPTAARTPTRSTATPTRWASTSLAHFPDLDVIRRSRLKKCTLFEMEGGPELEAMQQEYLKLAQRMLDGTPPQRPGIRSRTGRSSTCSASTDGRAAHASVLCSRAGAWIEEYFDRTAAETWAPLTSEAPVGRIRSTVREGRDRMRETLTGWLPADLTGRRVLDAGLRHRCAGDRTWRCAARTWWGSTCRPPRAGGDRAAARGAAAAGHLRVGRHAERDARQLRPRGGDGLAHPLRGARPGGRARPAVASRGGDRCSSPSPRAPPCWRRCTRSARSSRGATGRRASCRWRSRPSGGPWSSTGRCSTGRWRGRERIQNGFYTSQAMELTRVKELDVPAVLIFMAASVVLGVLVRLAPRPRRVPCELDLEATQEHFHAHVRLEGVRGERGRRGAGARCARPYRHRRAPPGADGSHRDPGEPAAPPARAGARHARGITELYDVGFEG